LVLTRRRAGYGVFMRILPLAALGGLAAVVARKLMSRGHGPSGGGGGPEASPPVAATSAPAEPLTATAPPEAPGPSVPAPVAGDPAAGEEWEQVLDTEAELPEERTQNRKEAIVEEEEAAAAAEAANIGGPAPREERAMDPEMRPVYEGGGGEAEGFEQAEEALIRNATHDDGRGDPARDAFRPESESDEASAVYAEADELPSTERLEDDEGRGPAVPTDD
jgi:hypothetical protein